MTFRFAVALLLASIAATARADVLVMRNGDAREGELRSCVGSLCRLDGEDVPRAQVGWIGLGAQAGAPPPSAPASTDRVWLRDGTTIDGQLVGISLGTVSFDELEWPRRDVAWIQLAGAGAAAPTPTPTPVPTPEGPGQGGGTDAGLPQTGETRGALWTGSYRAHFVKTAEGTTYDWTCKADGGFREWESPLIEPGTGDRVGRFLQLEPEGLTVEMTLHCRFQGGGCDGSGARSVTSSPRLQGIGHPSAIYLKETDRDLTPVVGFDVPRVGGLYFFAPTVPESEHWTTTWRASGATSTHDHQFACWVAGLAPLAGNTPDPQRRALDGGRMAGSYAVPWEEGQLTVSWSFCRGGGDCPPPP